MLQFEKRKNKARINLSFNIQNDIINGTIWTAYEFTNNSNYHYSQGNEKKLSDFLVTLNLTENKYNGSYNIRFDPHENYMKNQ